MMIDADYVLIPAAIAGLFALWPAWLLLARVVYSGPWWPLRVLMVFLIAAGLGLLTFWLPFKLSEGKTVGQFTTLIDLLLYGVFPLIAISLIAYALDHFSERPAMVVLGAASCLAIAGLPVAYYFLAERFHDNLRITFPTIT